MSVQPIQLSVDPVNAHALKTVAVVSDDVGPLLRSNLGFKDRLGRDVAEVNVVFLVIIVKRHHVSQILMNQVVMGSICRHVSQVVFVGEQNPRLNRLIPSFTSPEVGFTSVETLITLASKTSWTVDTLLATGAISWQFLTLIDVHTGFSILHQFVTWVTCALVTIRGVNTLVLTPVVLHPGTFILATMKRLITLIATIIIFVTNKLVVDALFVSTLEHVLSTSGVGIVTPNFVTTIMTVVLTITSVVLFDAPCVLTGEVVCWAGWLFTVFTLVTTISTVVIMVTLPSRLDASSILALELVLITLIGSVAGYIAISWDT